MRDASTPAPVRFPERVPVFIAFALIPVPIFDPVKLPSARSSRCAENSPAGTVPVSPAAFIVAADDDVFARNA
jgi:hypothetical protein